MAQKWSTDSTVTAVLFEVCAESYSCHFLQWVHLLVPRPNGTSKYLLETKQEGRGTGLLHLGFMQLRGLDFHAVPITVRFRQMKVT